MMSSEAVELDTGAGDTHAGVVALAAAFVLLARSDAAAVVDDELVVSCLGY